jgi:DMSO/TMAO reductase YedYZ molybdopterin-dependent catalytic subunit
MQKAKADVLLAFKMNGENLSAAHGAPVRAIVPGWYGMASVKWWTRIVVTSKPFHGLLSNRRLCLLGARCSRSGAGFDF